MKNRIYFSAFWQPSISKMLLLRPVRVNIGLSGWKIGDVGAVEKALSIRYDIVSLANMEFYTKFIKGTEA